MWWCWEMAQGSRLTGCMRWVLEQHSLMVRERRTQPEQMAQTQPQRLEKHQARQRSRIPSA